MVAPAEGWVAEEEAVLHCAVCCLGYAWERVAEIVGDHDAENCHEHYRAVEHVLDPGKPADFAPDPEFDEEDLEKAPPVKAFWIDEWRTFGDVVGYMPGRHQFEETRGDEEREEIVAQLLKLPPEPEGDDLRQTQELMLKFKESIRNRDRKWAVAEAIGICDRGIDEMPQYVSPIEQAMRPLSTLISQADYHRLLEGRQREAAYVQRPEEMTVDLDEVERNIAREFGVAEKAVAALRDWLMVTPREQWDASSEAELALQQHVAERLAINETALVDSEE
jgi:hypothetical protein